MLEDARLGLSHAQNMRVVCVFKKGGEGAEPLGMVRLVVGDKPVHVNRVGVAEQEDSLVVAQRIEDLEPLGRHSPQHGVPGGIDSIRGRLLVRGAFEEIAKAATKLGCGSFSTFELIEQLALALVGKNRASILSEQLAQSADGCVVVDGQQDTAQIENDRVVLVVLESHGEGFAFWRRRSQQECRQRRRKRASDVDSRVGRPFFWAASLVRVGGMNRRPWTLFLTTSVLTAGLASACDKEKDEPPAADEQQQTSQSETAPAERSAAEPDSKKQPREKEQEQEQGKNEPMDSGGQLAKPAALDSLDHFEGSIELEIRPQGQDRGQSVPLHVRDGKMRIDLPSQGGQPSPGFQLVNLTEGTMVSVVHQQKLAVEANFDEMKERFASLVSAEGGATPDSQGGAAKEKPVKMKKTGKDDEVADMACEEWEIIPPNRPTQRVCVAEISTSWFQFPEGKLPTDDPWAKELFDGNHFPLRIVQLDEGQPGNRLEVTRIEEKKLDASRFQVPKGYRKVSMKQMMMMQNMGKMGLGGPAGDPSAGNVSPQMREMMRKSPQMQEMMRKAQEQAASRAAQKNGSKASGQEALK